LRTYRPLRFLQPFTRCAFNDPIETVTDVVSHPGAHLQVVSGALAAGQWEHVPSLNSVRLLESLPPRTLVRLKCMVADVLEPEFYSAEMTVADSHGNQRKMRVLYEDQLHLPEGCVEVCNPDLESLLQRVSLMCVPVPGEKFALSWCNFALSFLNGPFHLKFLKVARRRSFLGHRALRSCTFAYPAAATSNFSPQERNCI
jgi:hypothetical protein